MTAVELGQLHARHIGQTVADINHVRERNAPLFLRHELVECAMLGDIQHALVNAEKELRFTGIVDRHGGPAGNAVFVIAEGSGVNLLKLGGDGRALNDLLQAGGDDIMLRRQPAAFRVGVDAGKPRRNAVKQLNVLA